MKSFISLISRRITVFTLTAALLVSIGCSKDDTSNNTPPNHAPEVTLPLTVRAVRRSNPQAPYRFLLSVNVSDPDGDPVTVLWEVVRNGLPSGELDPADQGQPSIEWRTPYTTGRDSIIVTASDGKPDGSTTLVETVQVGTLKTARITASETWYAVDSPFIVKPTEDNFVINERTTLTVEAGSELLIDRQGLTVSVQGILDINGTAAAPVTIRPNTRVSEPGDWQGILANPSGPPPQVRLDHTHILYAAEGIKAVLASEVYLDGCRIARSRDAAVWHGASGILQIENSRIESNENSGIKIIKTGEPLPTVVISADTVTSNGDLTGETVYSEHAGIYISMNDSTASASIAIDGCEIDFNGFPGIQLVGSCFPIIHNSVIYANELGKSGDRYNVRLDNGFDGQPDTIDATLNFWGASYPNPGDEALIKAMIRDSDDSATIGVRVVVDPWLKSRP